VQKSLDNYFCHFPTEIHTHTHTSMQMCVHAHTVLPHLYRRKKGTNNQIWARRRWAVSVFKCGNKIL